MFCGDTTPGMTSRISRHKVRMSDLCEPADICYHQEHHPGGGPLPQPKAA